MRMPIVAACVFLLALSGCAAAESDTAAACDKAVAAVAPNPGTSGMFFLVSLELARTLNSCGSADEWTSALQAHPEIVGEEKISDEDVLVYFSNVCDLLAAEQGESPICE